MSDTFRSAIRPLRTDVLSPRHGAEFAAARARHDALASHHTIATVLGALDDERRSAYPKRDALTRALLAEHQGSPSSFWAAVLLVAYYPMLSRLRHRIYGDTIPAGDLDQIVITTFLGVVAEFPLDERRDRTAMYLRQMTQREVFRVVREDQHYQEVVRLADPVEFERVGDPAWPPERSNGQPGPRNPGDAAAAVALLVEHAGDVLDGECFDMVAATSICGRQISRYLDRVAPDLDRDERARVYQRIKRRHSRALARLRPALAHLVCPREEEDVLCPSR